MQGKIEPINDGGYLVPKTLPMIVRHYGMWGRIVRWIGGKLRIRSMWNYGVEDVDWVAHARKRFGELNVRHQK
jgi:hypothetical protein